MAIEDFFEGAGQQYGQLAGSLLAGRRREDKKRAERALIASAILSGFGALQNNQKRKIIDATDDLKESYNISHLGRQELYNSELNKTNRDRLTAYNSDPDKAITDLARQYYNESDLNTKRNMTFNNRSLIPDEETRKIDEEFYQSLRNKAQREFDILKDNPLYSSSSFQDYNKAYYNEYKAALSQIEDDPTKTSVLRAAVNKIFPKAFDQKEAELEYALENKDRTGARDIVKAQEERQLMPPRQEQIFTKEEALQRVEDIIIQQDIDTNTADDIYSLIESQPNSIGFRNEDIFDLALTGKILNPANKDEIDKSVEDGTRVFEARLVRTNTELSSVNDIDRTSPEYKSQLDEYLAINVFQVDPTNYTIAGLVNAISTLREQDSLTATERSRLKVAQKQLQDLEGADRLELIENSVIASLIPTLSNPAIISMLESRDITKAEYVQEQLHNMRSVLDYLPL